MTSSSWAPARAAARWRTPWLPQASGSCCSSGVTSCPGRLDNWDPGPVFVDGKYISPDTWYDADGKPFQPQVHYFVGGATKMYGAALYRLRAGGLRRAAARRRHLAGLAAELRRVRAVVHEGRVAVPGARSARRGPDRGALVAGSTRGRRSRTSRGVQQISDALAAGGYHPFHAPVRDPAGRGRPRRPASASGARPATATRAWCTPRPTPRSSRCARCWTSRT